MTCHQVAFLYFDVMVSMVFAERLANNGGPLVSLRDFYGAGGSNNLSIKVVKSDNRIE